MEGIQAKTISNTENASKKSDSKLVKTAKIAGLGAGVGATVQGAGEALKQRYILKNGDEFLGSIAGQKEFHSAFLDGSEEAAKAAKDKIDEAYSAAEKFIKNGKMDFKKIGKVAAKGALIAGATWGAIYFVGKTVKDIVSGKKENKE